jgi:Ca2+/H+ antiporter
MNTFVDTVMIILFVLFMFFVFGGYHKNKYAQREAEEEKQNSATPKEESSK